MLKTECPNLHLCSRGKVRDLYEINEDTLLFVATDRISAFDVVMKNGVPEKGKILTQMSVFWFEILDFPNHLITADINQMPSKVKEYKNQLEGRCMLVKKLKIVPVEAIVRGYLAGSGWIEYKKSQTVCGIKLPPNLKEFQRLPEPIFTPSTKEVSGHDQNISFHELESKIGSDLAEKLKSASITLYKKASEYAESKGIIIADTKFEFGVHDNVLYLADEVLTPDSSRFWEGSNSFDKQFVRNYLLQIEFGGKSIELPEDIILETKKRYQTALSKLFNH